MTAGLGLWQEMLKGLQFFLSVVVQIFLTNDSENVNFQVVDGGVVVIKEIFQTKGVGWENNFLLIISY